MKKWFSILLLFSLFQTSIFANWMPYFNMSDSKPIPEQENQIQMKDEHIRIFLLHDKYEMKISYTFFNHGKDKQIKMVFPMYTSLGVLQNGMPEDEVIDYFRKRLTVFVNGHVVNCNFARMNEGETPKVFVGATLTMKFKANQKLNMQVIYDGEYNKTPADASVEIDSKTLQIERQIGYLYGTASYWHKNIENFQISLSKIDPSFSSFNFQYEGNKSFEFTKKNPNLNLKSFKPKSSKEEFTLFLSQIFKSK